MNSPAYNEELYNLAIEPLSTKLYLGCHVNNIKLLGVDRDDKLCTHNNRVHVLSARYIADVEFYDKLKSAVQLLYKDRCQVILLKCHWFDTDPRMSETIKRDDGLLSINTNWCWYNDKLYILATMAKQIFYLNDLKAKRGRKIVHKIAHIGVYDIPEWDADDGDDDDNYADQHLETLT